MAVLLDIFAVTIALGTIWGLKYFHLKVIPIKALALPEKTHNLREIIYLVLLFLVAITIGFNETPSDHGIAFLIGFGIGIFYSARFFSYILAVAISIIRKLLSKLQSFLD
jgi:hypothetical protein